MLDSNLKECLAHADIKTLIVWELYKVQLCWYMIYTNAEGKMQRTEQQ